MNNQSRRATTDEVHARAQVCTEINEYVRNFENEVNQAFLKYFPVQVFRFIIKEFLII